jgi:anti-sigma B factor antagonist
MERFVEIGSFHAGTILGLRLSSCTDLGENQAVDGQPLQIDEREHSTIVVVGDIDANTVVALTTTAINLDAHGRIDLSECGFIDSSGIAWLVAAKNSAEARNGSITLIAPSQPVVRLLGMCGLADVFDIEPAAR